ncbi:hypothetical protein K7432_013934 [Basidiobolus ranarum]|uniref:Carrier domain-containing protein n=1 Tax=Basidiobolus ranarum TaxID=34480 RepID=A0ABR2VQB4_9FUNG
MHSFAHQEYEAPQGDIERGLAAIWKELLGLEHISRHDNFFELGGHSLLAVRMISHIRAKLGIEIDLRMFFEAPFIVNFANQIQMKDDAPSNPFDVWLPIQPKGNRPPLYCIHPVIGLSWSYIGLSKYLDSEQPVYGLQARGLDEQAPVGETIEAMALDYLDQIRSIQPKGPYHLLGWSFGGSIAHSIAISLQQQNETVALLALIDSPLAYAHLENQCNLEQVSTYVKLPRYSVDHYSEQGEQLWKKVRRVVENNLSVAKKHFPLVYYGNALFIRATVPEDEGHPLVAPDMLKPYVHGNIETHNINCKHSDMDNSAPIAAIGRILANKLNERDLSYSIRARL